MLCCAAARVADGHVRGYKHIMSVNLCSWRLMQGESCSSALHNATYTGKMRSASSVRMICRSSRTIHVSRARFARGAPENWR